MKIISGDYILQGTNLGVIEPAPDKLRLRVFVGTNDKGEKVKVYVQRIEKIEPDKKENK